VSARSREVIAVGQGAASDPSAGGGDCRSAARKCRSPKPIARGLLAEAGHAYDLPGRSGNDQAYPRDDP